tara:strand:+ start:5709 stop:6056 length:348 start_codon:yes stop_codon:yes gene_type:complete
MLGGAIGALARFGIYEAQAKWLSLNFPYATLFVNIVGSFIIGACSVWLMQRTHLADELRLFIMVGVLGAFTTFSTFSLETIKLLQMQEYGVALSNIGLNIVLCLVAAWLGMMVIK